MPFQSPGGNAQQAIQQFLIQRAMLERQRKLDELQQQAQEQELAQRAQQMQQQTEELKLRQQQEKRMGEQQKTQQADLENQREFTKASTIANQSLPNDPVDAETVSLLKRQGLGGQVTPGVVAQGPFQGNDEQDIPQYGVLEQPATMRGGAPYMNARAAAEERAAAAREAQAARASEGELTRTAAAERATEANQTRRDCSWECDGRSRNARATESTPGTTGHRGQRQTG